MDSMKKVSRNDPCPCNSGRKYKHCCQKLDEAKATPIPNTRPQVLSHPSIPDYLQLAIEYHKSGHLAQAEAIYRQILQVAPDHPGALHFLGLIARQMGKIEIAIKLISRALAFKPDYAEAHGNLGNALARQGRLEEAVASFHRALTLKPDLPEVYGSLGNVLKDQGKLDEAIISYREALALKPDFAEIYSNLGNALNDLGRPGEATLCYQNALRIKPDFVEAYNNLGNVLIGQGRLEEAVASFRNALRRKPGFSQAHSNLGNALRELGRLDEAVASYRQALACQPDYAEAHGNLGNALVEQGKLDEAITSYQCALQIRESFEIKSGFAQCIKNICFTHEIIGIRPLLARALSEPWARPAELTNPAISLIKLNPGVKECVDRAINAWPAGLSQQELFGPLGLAAVCDDSLFRCLLENTMVCDVELERFLTIARRNLLDIAIVVENTDTGEDISSSALSAISSDIPEEKILIFYCALARQCFINEYVFFHSAEELDQAKSLQNRLVSALAAGFPVPLLWLIAVAAYFPLVSLPSAESLLKLSGSHADKPAIAALLTQQVEEPLQERRYRADIPQLTPIADDVSRLVQKQYEENPYPRWVKLPPGNKPVPIDVYLRSQFPLVAFNLMDSIDKRVGGIDILIAGCGTGQHSITTARRYRDARVLAIDLSLTSLCYAKRKTHELELENIDYAQADIMGLGSPILLGRTFDIIESVGVLHHLSDPLAGWRVLHSLLRPGGFMRVGFYSKNARQSESMARGFIAKLGYKSIPEDIRRCRQDLMSAKNADCFGKILAARDFYGMSECRDLLFHVQEHRYTLPQIKENLQQLGLAFIGFSLDASIVKQYRQCFPVDQSGTDLDNWTIFESENPDTFTGMYQFWVQKPVEKAGAYCRHTPD